MANEEQLEILKQGVEVWNKWLEENPTVAIDLRGADLSKSDLSHADFYRADLFTGNLSNVNLNKAILAGADLWEADLTRADLSEAFLEGTNLTGANLKGSNFWKAEAIGTIFGNVDLSEAKGLKDVIHTGPSPISTGTFAISKGKIPEVFLRGCGLSDWEIEMVQLYDPDLSKDQRKQILDRIFDLQASQPIQISPLFISYSHGDSEFVNKIEKSLTEKGIRFWRDIHDLKAGRIEIQIDRAITQDRTVLLILSEHSLKSDWVEHEVRTARQLEKDLDRDVLCPVALDVSWRSSRWPKRLMEQIMEYNILDFSGWQDDKKFDGMFRKLIDGLELFYKG
jgi:hypothetical protein